MHKNRRGIVVVLITFFSVLVPLAAVVSPAAADPLSDIRIDEVESNGGTPGDWVELTNIGSSPLDVSGWRIKDNDDGRTFAIPADTTVPAGGFVAVDVDVAGGFGLGGDDSARLYLADGTTLVDSYSWTGGHAATTYGRCPDGTGTFRLTTSPTKGAANDCSSPVKINEVESNGDATDWIELYNPSAGPADISGFVLKDSTDNDPLTISAGTVLAAGAYLAFDPAFGLGSGDSARLFDGATLVDSHTWTSHAPTTYGRCPNGTGDFTTTTSSTKGAANDCGIRGLTSIKINEVESDPDDWIELTNVGATAVDISGWVLKDDDPANSTVIPATTSLAPGAFAAFDTSFGLGDGDQARILAPDGVTLADSYTFAGHAVNTWGRCPDGTGSFVDTVSATKGAANDCATGPDLSGIAINEVESSGGTPGDWVELVNTGSNPVDIGGLVFKDNADADVYTIPAATSMDPGGYYVLEEADFVFGLGGSDSARLFRADGTTLVDSYTWTSAAAGTTYGRCPDGYGPFDPTLSATKGTANDCTLSVPSTVKVNEIESNGDAVGDWTELVNTGATSVSIAGLRFRDSDPSHAFYAIPRGTEIAAGGYYVLDEADFGFGLGSPDSATLYAADASTVVDTFAWTPHATTSYGRCPDGTGEVTTTTTPTRGAANDCNSPVRINEVESSDGDNPDWVELVNPSGSAIDVSGWVLKDDDDTHAATIPASTSIPATGYLAIDTSPTFGLGDADSARLFQADGTTLVDSYAWTTGAATTYGRCPNASGAFATTNLATKGASNSCPGDLVTSPWPGGTAVSTVDPAGVLGGDMSGLAYEPGVLWGVNNGAGALVRMTPDGGGWAVASTRLLHYPGGAGVPDSEGMTLSGTGSAGGVYVATERNNSANTVSRPAILRFHPAGAGDLTATDEWNLTADLPTVAANSGLEGITWVPDSYLTESGFTDENTGAPYTPSTYPNHGSGLFLVGLEGNGRIYAYALNPGGTFTRVASFASGFVAVMDLAWDPERVGLWAVCDDTCAGRTTILRVDAGVFAVDEAFERPSGMPNLNNEGFAVTPQSECVDGSKPVFWVDDGNTGGHALRAGTLDCTDLPDEPTPPAPQMVTFTSTPPATPVVGQTWGVTATGGASGNPVVLSVPSGTAGVCSLAGSTVRFDHAGSCVVEARQAGNASYDAGFATRTVTVGKAATTTTVSIGASRLTATVAPVAPGAGAPSGTVTFTAGGSTLGTATLAGGVATLPKALPAGTSAVSATYPGDGDFTTSSGTATRSNPTIEATLSSEEPSSGWYRRSVTVTFICTPNGAPLAGACPAPVTLSADGADQSVSRTVTATDGGTATVTVDGIDIDRSGPRVRIIGVKGDKTYHHQPPRPRCKATDGLSGVRSCTIARTRDGNRVKVVATATDRAGNVTRERVTYRIARG